eukprot:CAMPEP_0174841900 /NCGR_PEP_ID=MMETSP1114-20130205/9604_1 /TAXON_ID=312471 /ORGANISM="Neobodo designis, Strain CCAP 1951/1" /LENGTH=402 /DNA_ID=CAMNT_0016076099 /DNA_START=45 /DNA_END=1253 /DNA_ORIENTATION=+
MAGTDPSAEEIIAKLSPEDQVHMRRLIFGAPVETVEVPAAAKAMADKGDFEVAIYKTACAQMQMTAPRRVRVAVIQNAVPLSPSAPLKEQYDAICARVEELLNAAAAAGANVVCLQEAWTGPFFFCTREKQPWLELAEEAATGPSFEFISRIAKKHNMVIVSPILERDGAHGETIWNTAVVVGNNGNYIGKHRKNHIPRVGDFNESTYYMEGNTGHPVFETAFGKIAINICYGRHHPLNWLGFGLNGAEIVFNPSATVGALSEPLWPIEGRNAAIANTYFVGAINRVGTETFPNAFTSGDGKPQHADFGHFYGSSYVANPDGSRTPGLSRNRDGVLVNDIDLNLTRIVRDKWVFQMTGRHDLYAELLAKYVRHDFVPQVIRDPALTDNAAPAGPNGVTNTNA